MQEEICESPHIESGIGGEGEGETQIEDSGGTMNIWDSQRQPY